MGIKWMPEEELYMERYYLLRPVNKIAEKLNRSVSSVKHKAARMGLNHYTNSYHARTIASCFKVDFLVVKRWIEKFGLPCKTLKCSNGTRYMIEADDFWNWAEKHRDIINWSKYERLSMCPEPGWLEDEIKNYATPKSRVKFTEQEIILVKGMLHRRLGYKEIAAQTGRSYYSISHLCRKIYK